MSADIEAVTALWARLTEALDFRAGKWWSPDERGAWVLVSWASVHDLLFDLDVGAEPEEGVADPERDRVIEEFKRRDRATTVRTYSDVERAARRLDVRVPRRMRDEHPQFNFGL